MDLNEPNEASSSITESSQEWHILNLLRVGERDLFETNFQEFRKIQLTESQDGKVRLCKLINEILRLDPQYSIILVEDLSHLFNDSNYVVQKFALFSIADSLSILFSHIVASNTLVESFKANGSLDSCKSNHMARCRSNKSWINTGHHNHYNGTNTPINNQTDHPDGNEDLPFSVDNVRVFESFSDFACIRFMTHIRLLEESFADVKYKSLHSLHYLIHTRTRFYSVNLLKLLFFELSNYPNYLCRECTDDSHQDSNLNGNEHQKQAKGSKDKKKGAEKSEEGRFDMYDTLYKWHKESVQLLQHLISTYIESSKDKAKTSGSKFFKSKQPDGEKSGTKEEKLVGCILASEVATCLICFYPDFYFHSFADFLVPLLATSHSVVFENILFRLFSTDKCVKYHHQLLLKVNEYGYDLDLKEVYKLVQTLPSRYRENRKGTMVVVNKNESFDKNKQFDLTDKLVSCLEVDLDPNLSEYPAAQLFEFDKELVKNYRKIKTSQIKIDRNFYKNKPAELTPILYPAPYTDHAPDGQLKRSHETDGVQTDYEYYNDFNKKPKELRTVTDEVIANNEKLFVRLVGCQMIDTVATYKRFLRFEVIGPKLVRFDSFSKCVLNHLLLSNVVEFENRREVLCNLLNHLAEHILVNHADLSFFRQHRDFEQMTYGLSALFTYVSHAKDVELFVKYLNYLTNLVVYSYTTNLAKSLVTYRNKHTEDDYFMKMYENFVNLALSYVCEFLSEMGEYGDFCVHALSKFVLNLPKVPSRIADLIVLWVNSDKQGNVKLAFSLVSNLLKLSESVTRVDFSSLLGSQYYKYTSNLSFVRRSIFVVFLSCITTQQQTVSELFLKLISSQKGLYTTHYSYTLKHLQSLHDEFVDALNRQKDSKDAQTTDFFEDCLYLSDRPVWQWPTKLVQSVLESGKYKSFAELVDLSKCDPSDDTDTTSSDNIELDGNDQLKVHMYYSDNDTEEVNEDIGAWIEESVALMSIPNSLKSSKFIHNTARNLVKLRQSSDKNASKRTDSSDGKNMNVEENDSKMDVDDSDDDMVIYDDDEAPEQPGPAPASLYYEPMLACCSKSARLVFRLADLAAKCAGTDFYTKCSQTLSQYPRELHILIKYSDEYSEFVESALRETRKRWSDLMFKYDERTSLDRELMLLLIAKMGTVPEYLIQMSPFLSRDQLDSLMVHLFRNYEKEKLIKILDTIIETPKIVLPQHFLYSTYNFQVSATASTDKERDYMKLQVSLLDTCITYCTHGKFSVESAISSLYLIVESFENINFVFGRLLCQFVQKIPLTRKVIVDVIFPKLIQKQCWQDKQLFKGVVLSICALWNQFKDQLVRHILEMPNSNIKTVLRALQSQHSIADYFKGAGVPPSLQALYEEVAASAASKSA